MGLNFKPYRSQLKDKMVKNKKNNKGWANDVNVINKGKENTKGKNAHIKL